MRDRLPLLAGLTLLAAAIAVGSFAIAGGIRDRGRSDTITVTGSAKARISSDYVIWDPSVTSSEPTAEVASNELARWTKQVRAFLADEGVAGDELSVQPIATQIPGGTDANGDPITNYQLTRTFEIRSSRVAAVSAVAEASSRLLAKGVPLAGDPPQYVYTQLKSLRPRLLAKAIADAQERARVIVRASHAKLGDVRGVDVGVFQVTAPNSTDVSDYGVYDTSTVPKDVTAVVNVTFTLD